MALERIRELVQIRCSKHSLGDGEGVTVGRCIVASSCVSSARLAEPPPYHVSTVLNGADGAEVQG